MKRLCLFVVLTAVYVMSISACGPAISAVTFGAGAALHTSSSGEENQKPEKEIIYDEKGNIKKIIFNRK